jgi:hypothetical protein
MKLFEIKHFLFVMFLYSICSHQLFSQDLLTNPTSVKWSKIKSDHFKMIYPKGLDSIANRTINVLETNYLPGSNSLGKQPRPISVIIQNQNTVSNGFVTFTPRRSEFFITPPQDYTLLGTYNWFDQLAKHEFRHIVQQDKVLTGGTKVAHKFIGNYGISGLSYIVAPPWFKEGDAVGIETAHSLSGRGSIPAFSMLMRAQLVDYQLPFSFSKANGRSFKHNIPDHYVLGYHLTSFMKEKYGFDVFDRILEKTFKFPIYPFSFSNNIKKVTGKSIDKVYNETYLSLKSQVKRQIENNKLYEESYLNTSKTKYYTDYEYPQVLNNGSVLAMKSGLAHIAQFVVLDKYKKEKKVFTVGSLNDALTLSAANNKVVWAEYNPDARWGMRNFSNIRTYDLNTGKVQQLTKKARLAAPAISPDGRQIVAVNTSEDGKYSLRLMNAETGIVFKEFANAENVFYQHPSWAADGKSIVTIALLNNEKTIQSIDIETGTVKILLPFSNNNLAHPILNGKLLLYNNARNGVDNVYMYDLETNKNWQVTNAKFGAFNAVFSEKPNEILFSDFTSLGHRIGKLTLDFNNMTEVDLLENKNVRLFGNWMLNEASKTFESDLQKKDYTASKFSKWNVLNINSWGFVANPTGSGLTIGVDTQDLLSTTTTSIGASYNIAEQQTGYFANFSYQGLFPIFDLGFENEGRQTIIPKGAIPQTKDKALTDNWRQQAITLGVKFPLKYQRNMFINNFTFGSTFAHIEGQGYNLPVRSTVQIANSSVQSLTNYFNFSRKIKQAKRDVSPRWEQNLLVYSRNTPFGKNLQSTLGAVQASLVFPGIGKHDNFRLRANLLTNGKNNNYYFSSPLPFPRGYEYTIFERMTSASVDYRFPIADPDLAIGRMLYIQRLKGNLFGDFGQGQLTDDKNNLRKFGYNSVGADFSAIFNIMRFQVPIELGVRFNYIPKPRIGEQQFTVIPLILDIPF